MFFFSKARDQTGVGPLKADRLTTSDRCRGRQVGCLDSCWAQWDRSPRTQEHEGNEGERVDSHGFRPLSSDEDIGCTSSGLTGWEG